MWKALPPKKGFICFKSFANGKKGKVKILHILSFSVGQFNLPLIRLRPYHITIQSDVTDSKFIPQ